MKVLLADDHGIVRQGLRSLLERESDLDVVGEAEDGREAIKLFESKKPDLVIMDIAMPGLNGLEALLQLRNSDPFARVIILSMHLESNYVIRALRLGASGYVYKGSVFDDLRLAIQAVQNNDIFLSPAVSRVLVAGLLQSAPGGEVNELLELLSPREREIIQLIGEGKSRTEIADIMTISVKTVDRHKENLKEKLQLKQEEEIATMAQRLGLCGF